MPTAYRQKHHSPHKRTKIVTMYRSGVSLDDIVAKEGVTKHAIFGLVRRYDQQKSAKSNSRSGRPATISQRDKNHIFRIIERDPFITVQELCDEAGLRCHRSTLSRYLKKNGIQHHLASRRPFLSDSAAQKRKDFAARYKDEDASFWHNWIFSDECSIARGDGEKWKWAFTRYGERLKKKNVQPQRKPSRHSQMFFSAFTIDRATDLVCLEGDPDSDRSGVTSRIILGCLQEHLPEIISEGSVFQHDNGPTFKSHLVQDWLRKYATREGLVLIEWPPHSPDLNPIENLWAILKERICKRYPELSALPKTRAAKERLIECAKELWHELEDEVFENLLDSMPRRMKACYDADGWYTKY